MDAACVQQQSVTAGRSTPTPARALRWDGDGSADEVALALSFVLPLLPLDARARAACVCRAWRAAAAAPALWEELDFARCAARVDDATLAALCARRRVAALAAPE